MSTDAVVVIVGDGEVGKTTLLAKLLQQNINQFTETKPTIIDNVIFETNFLGKKKRILFVDISGQEAYEELRHMHYPTANIICICYAVNNRASYNNVTNVWWESINNNINFRGKLILIATKNDLRNDENEIERLESVKATFISEQLGVELKNNLKMVDFLECSALTDAGEESIVQVRNSILTHCFGPETPKKSSYFHRFCKCSIL